MYVANVNEAASDIILVSPVKTKASASGDTDVIGEVQVVDPDEGDVVQFQVFSHDVCFGAKKCSQKGRVSLTFIEFPNNSNY